MINQMLQKFSLSKKEMKIIYKLYFFIIFIVSDEISCIKLKAIEIKKATEAALNVFTTE